MADGVQYFYDAQNKRVWQASCITSGYCTPGTGWVLNLNQDTVNLFGTDGKQLASYQAGGAWNPSGGINVAMGFSYTNTQVYFGGRLVGQQVGTNGYLAVIQDRLGSVGKYYPYGEERNAPQLPNDQVKFATYTRDSATENDYADQRYYTSTLGRFMTPDPAASAKSDLPQSWNRYNYASTDPVNNNDPTGLDDEGGDDQSAPPISFGGANPPRQTPVRSNDNTPYPKCNPTDNASVDHKIDFILAHYDDAMTEANNIQNALGPVTINTQNLATTFLMWSMNESGYGLDPPATINNNYFGDAGHNSQYSVTCPAGASPGPACYSSSFSWLGQLAFGLSLTPHTPNDPNPGNVSYAGFLESVLTSNPNASSAEILDAIGSAGWNPYPNYGDKIAGGSGFPGIKGIPGLIDCLKKNYGLK